MEKVCIIIPACDEIYLQKTIDSVIQAAAEEIEIVPILDGYKDGVLLNKHPHVKPIIHKKSLGQRQSINEAARQTDCKYILKTDAHSKFDRGFDKKLKTDCEYDWTVIPRMYNLDEKKWEPKWNKKTDFMWIRSPHIEYMPLRARYWDKPTAIYYPIQYEAFKNNPDNQGDICDVMTGQGACWFMHLERFWELGGMDEKHGQWGQMGVEVACKAWLSGGSLKVNKKTWFAHLFRGGNNSDGFPWPASGTAQEYARKYSVDLWSNNKWAGQKQKLQWLADKFRPVPTWHTVLRDIATSKQNTNKCKSIDGYCKKIYDKVGLKVYIDDNGCDICSGKPKMPKPIKPQEMTRKQIYYKECRKLCNDCTLCPLSRKPCNAGKLDKGFSCIEDIWPEPPKELKKAYDILMPQGKW